MKKIFLAAVAGVALALFSAALLASTPLLVQQNAAAATLIDIICTSTGLPNPLSASAHDPSGEHNEAPNGLYMPMFSTPPKGGLIYNGPPLDQC